MSDALASPPPEGRRIVIVGRNSVLWSRIADRLLALRPDTLAVGHGDIAGLRLGPGDRLWIFSYAPDAEANRALFDRIAALGAGHHVYLSSATANIADRIRCYRYPAVKAQGESDAANRLNAATVRIGLIHDDPDELPGGASAATRLDDLVALMAAGAPRPDEEGEAIHLYRLIERPFSGAVERTAFNLYGALLRLAGTRPCLLRPLDLVLRTLGWRWYGYFRLSNEQCRTTT